MRQPPPDDPKWVRRLSGKAASEFSKATSGTLSKPDPNPRYKPKGPTVGIVNSIVASEHEKTWRQEQAKKLLEQKHIDRVKLKDKFNDRAR